jgi:hypothetical protein
MSGEHSKRTQHDGQPTLGVGHPAGLRDVVEVEVISVVLG